MIIYNLTDLASVCAPQVACSPNGLGAGTGIAGRQAVEQAQYGSKEVTVTMDASESSKIYVAYELNPTVGPSATRAWFKTLLSVPFNITSKNANVDLVRVDVCHLSATCVSLELLGSDVSAVNLGPSERDFEIKTLTVAAASNVVQGDRVAILFSFTNNTAVAQTFGWTPGPNLDIRATDWGFERPEMTLGRKRAKKKPDDDEALLVALEEWE